MGHVWICEAEAKALLAEWTAARAASAPTVTAACSRFLLGLHDK